MKKNKNQAPLTTLGLAVIVLHILTIGCASKRDVLNEKYPYARLTPDFGVLDENDLKKNEEIATPLPFSKDSISYPYWKCFPTVQVKLSCDGREVDERDPPIARLLIRAEQGVRFDEYEGRNTFTMSTCHERLEQWKSLVKGETYTCIAGSYIGPEVDKKRKSIQGDSWIYDRLKTKKGCDSYFENDCVLNNGI